MQERVGVGIIEIITGRNLGEEGQIFAAVLRRGVGVFSVEEQDVRHIAPRLQHLATAGEIIRPDPGVGSPGFVPVEPLPVAEQRQSGQVVIRWLGCAVVDDKAVEAAGKRDVRDTLDVAGMVGIGALVVPIDGKGLRRGEVLPVDVGDGCAFPDVGNRGGKH